MKYTNEQLTAMEHPAIINKIHAELIKNMDKFWPDSSFMATKNEQGNIDVAYCINRTFYGDKFIYKINGSLSTHDNDNDMDRFFFNMIGTAKNAMRHDKEMMAKEQRNKEEKNENHDKEN